MGWKPEGRNKGSHPRKKWENNTRKGLEKHGLKGTENNEEN